MTADRSPPRALQGLRVLDLSRVLAGPCAAQTLGDLGAEVVKIERPGAGDEARNYGPPLRRPDGSATAEGAMYLSANRNKRSLAVDLGQADGQALIRRMATQADVLIENFKAGSLAAYGLDAATLLALNPRLVYCSITGYGQSGPYADRPGYDALFQAQSGMMELSGHPDGEPGGGPMRMGLSLVDLMTSQQAVIAIQAALLERERSGLGQHIDMALLDCAIAALSNVAQGYLVSDQLPPRTGNGAGSAGPAEVLPCADGDIYLTAPSNALFQRLCQAIGQPELAKDPRFATPGQRGQARALLREQLAAQTRQQPRAELVATLVAAGVPAGPVNTLDQALNDPQARHREVTVTLAHPDHPALALLSSPLRLTRTPPRHELPPPRLGQHSQEVLRDWLDLNDADIAALRACGAVA